QFLRDIVIHQAVFQADQAHLYALADDAVHALAQIGLARRVARFSAFYLRLHRPGLTRSAPGIRNTARPCWRTWFLETTWTLPSPARLRLRAYPLSRGTPAGRGWRPPSRRGCFAP